MNRVEFSPVEWMLPAGQAPNLYSLVKGAAEGPTRLNAFDNALLRAGVGDTNLVKMSSILPPGARHSESADLKLPKGGLIPVAYAALDSKESGRLISAAIAAGIPEEENEAGVIMEFEDHAPLHKVEDTVKRMVRDAFLVRDRGLKEILWTGVEHKVTSCGAVFAGVVLWFTPQK